MLLCLSFALSGYNYLYGMSATRFEALEETLNAASAIPNLESQQQLLRSDGASTLVAHQTSDMTKPLSQMKEQQVGATTHTKKFTEQRVAPNVTRPKSNVRRVNRPHAAMHTEDPPRGSSLKPPLRLSNLTENATLNSDNYFELIQKGHFEKWAKLPPIELMQTYIQDFSQQALEKKWQDCGGQKPCGSLNKMKFVVGRYSCPLEAGNRMFKFMNHLVWAIVTRKVFLWGYWDDESCRIEATAGELEIELYCDKMMNSVADCKEVLQLAKWVPSWDEWSLKLNLTTQPVRACALGNNQHDGFAFPMDGSKVPRVIRVGQQNNLELGLILFQEEVAPELLHKQVSRNRARALFRSQGLYFGYGMLFEALFTLHPSLLPEPYALDNGSSTYLLHSRHTLETDDGSDISLDESCMKKVIANRTDYSMPCIVFAMSDRAATRERLPLALAEFNCTAVFSNNTTGGSSVRYEHGPFAGRGYYEDLALVRNARRGFMAPNVRSRTRVGIRTSSALPRSIIEFRRVLESASVAAIPEFKECIAP